LSTIVERPQELFVEKLPLIERVIDSVCRRHCCFGPDAEDFGSTVKLKLMDDDYAVIRKFRGQSAFSTYLTTVIANQYRDYRIQRWGKWRNSALAKRHGTVAEQLEKLRSRDGHSFDETYEILQTHLGDDAPSREELDRLDAEIPVRPQRRFEGEERLESLPGGERADRRLVDAERAAALERALASLERARAALPAEDRLIVKLRFEDRIAGSTVAHQLGIPQRLFYSRSDKILKNLKTALEEDGVGAEVIDVLDLE
jgi:RNA polymerase sigma factor for flagellar operon FliA